MRLLRLLLATYGSPDGKLIPPEERPVVETFCREMKRLLRRRRVEITPLVVLRVEELLVSLLAVRRLTDALNRDGVAPAGHQAPPQQNAGTAVASWKSPGVHPAVESLGKAQERLRKAMQDFEEVCGRTGAPAARGLASRMKPILKQAEGVLEESLETEAEMKERMATECVGSKSAP